MTVLELSVIIVNYNVRYFLAHCLASVSHAIQGMQAEVIVVDNCSCDGSLDYLKEKFPSVCFIANTENTGFAKANNLALKQAKGDYVLYLNPDTLVSDNAISSCLAFFKSNATVGALGVKMVDGSGRFLPESKRAFPSPLVSFFKLCGLSKLFPASRLVGKYALGYLNEDLIHEVEVLAGAFLMARRPLLLDSKGFDERYFMYGEDIDLSYCLQQTGYKNYYLGNVSIIHFKGESAQKGSASHLKNFYTAMILFVDKYYKGWSGVIYRGVLKMAIAGRYLMSLVASIGTSKQKTTHLAPDLSSFSSIELLGDTTSARQAGQIWEKYAPQSAIHFTATKGTLMAVPMDKQPDRAWVLCIGPEFTYDAAIHFLERHAPVRNVYWHYLNFDSLISSSDKKGLGEVLVG